MRSQEQFEPNSSPRELSPELAESFREERFAVMVGYLERKVIELSGSEAAGRLTRQKLESLKQASPSDKIRYAAAFGAKIVAVTFAMAHMNHEAIKAEVLETALMSPEYTRLTMTAIKNIPPLTRRFLEASQDFIGENTVILQEATRDAINLFDNTPLSLNLNG